MNQFIALERASTALGIGVRYANHSRSGPEQNPDRAPKGFERHSSPRAAARPRPDVPAVLSGVGDEVIEACPQGLGRGTS